MDLTGFLFGNVNEEGELEDESLIDRESLSQLSRLGVDSVLGDIMRNEDGGGDSSDEYDSDQEQAPEQEKSPTAEDFTDITEVAEDETPAPTTAASTSGNRGKEAATKVDLSRESERLLQKGISFAQSQLAGPSTQFGTVTTDRGGDECDDDYDTTEPSDQVASGQTLQPRQPEAPSAQDSSQLQVPEARPAAEGLLDNTGGSVATPTPADQEQPLGSMGLELGSEPQNLDSGLGSEQYTQDSGFGGSDPLTLDSGSGSDPRTLDLGFGSDQPTLDSEIGSQSQIPDSAESQSDSHTPTPPPAMAYSINTQLRVLPGTTSQGLEPGVSVPSRVSATDSSLEPRMLLDSSSISPMVTATTHSDSNAAVESNSSAPILPQPQTVPASEPEREPEPHPTGSAIPALIPENMTLEELHKKVKKLFPGFKPQGILRFSSLLVPKPSSLPKIWRGAKKPKKKSKAEGEGSTPWVLDLDFVPPPEMCMSDDEDKLLAAAPTPSQLPSGRMSRARQSAARVDPETREWRFGPARPWYDQIGVPEDGRGLTYGFKLKQPTPPHDSSEDEGKPPSLDGYEPPDDAFLMVTQQNWENKILWEVPYTPGPPITGAGGTWSTPDSSTTHHHLLVRQLSQSSTSSDRDGSGTVGSGGGGGSSGPTHSMFPIENYDLIYKRWEDDIIWDSDAVKQIPKPSVVKLDPNDPNIILGIPVEPVASTTADKEGKKDIRKTSKFLMNKMNRSNDSASSSQSSFLSKKDMFNLSNDEYYNPKHASSTQGLSGFDSNVVQHSHPAWDLYPPWFPTHMGTSTLRHFHRPRLRIRCARGEETTGFYPINNLRKHIARKEKERERERVSSGGGEVFFMRNPEDLSACDDHLVLAECCEQYPPVVMATGMATKIKNYYRRPERQVKSHAPELEYGETTYTQNTSYFLGQLKPGQTLQSFENNLFRASIYHHTVPRTDFLVVVSGNQVHIREVENVFVVGQECPKVEIPAPNSKPATQFQKEFLQVFLYNLFRESDENPKRIKMDVVRKAFPPADISESVIRKVLKLCADFKREGYETGWWVLRSDFRLPSKEEVRSMISPEQWCAYAAMLAAEQRLKDAGYRGKSLFTVEEEEEESSSKIDDEIRAAPWNTTHHFINAMKGKYQLSVNGPADPTGCGEGFSYTRLNTRRDTSNSGLPPGRRCKSVMGTDGDLRKLKLSKARNVLRNFGVPEDEISKLSRWQVIDMVRTISTEAAKSGEGVNLKNLKFARGARFSQMEAQEKYREECQRVFDLQNKVLSSQEVLSTDEESSSSGGESDDELGRNLETLLKGKKTSAQLSHEQEEAERQELRRLFSEDKLPSMSKNSEQSGEISGRATPSGDADDTSSIKSFSSVAGRRLVISRTFCDEEGREYMRHEVVKNQAVVDTYVRLMASGSKDVRSQFADQDEQTREDMKKEKRRIQDQLRRLKKIEEKAKKKSSRPQKPKPLTTIKMRCSACGQRGHMKTNKNCPMYKNSPVTVAPTDEEVAQHEASISQDDLVKVEGTKVVLHKAVVEHAIDVRRKSLLLKFPKDRVRKRRRHGEEELDYLEKRAKSVQRRKMNPEVPFSALLEKILQKLAGIPESAAFRKPVQAKTVPDYYNVIKFPMDLQTMRDNCRKHQYTSREDFWEHINLIVNNCITYNGFKSELTRNAQKMLEACSDEMKSLEKDLEQLEQEINPALDDNAQVALSYLLGRVVNSMKAVPDTWPFHHPVSAKKIPDYNKIIKRPMDLDTIKKSCSRNQYQSRDQFLLDLNQIVDNSITYNGPNSHYTQTAERMRAVGLQAIDKDADHFLTLETRLVEHEGSSLAPTPLGSPPSSVQDSSFDMFDMGHSQLSQASSNSAMVLESGVGGEVGEGGDIDVEGWEEGGEDVNLLLQDLQHSSSSSDSDSESEMEDDIL